MLYGTAVSGMSPSALQRCRSGLVHGLGFSTGGRCNTTALRLRSSVTTDPYVEVPVSTLQLFFELWRREPEQQPRIRAVWPTFARVHRPKVRWGEVAGPAAAAYATWCSIGWTPVEPDRIIDHAGEVWQLGDGPLGPFMQHLRRYLDMKCWQQASLHWGGGGLQGGAYLGPTKRFIASLREQGHSAKAGMLEATLAATIWPAARLHACQLVEDDLCPRCQAAPETAMHRYWLCPVLREVEIEEVRASQHLLQLAVEQQEVAACLWCRGVPPTAMYCLKPPADTAVEWKIGDWGVLAEEGGIFGTDGAGGKHSSEPRLRRCGFSAVCLRRSAAGDGRLQLRAAMWSTLAGQHQSVPRAEMSAILWLLGCIRGPLVVHTDHWNIVRRWKSGNKNSAGAMSDLWYDFWALVEARVHPVVLHWVPSHRNLDAVEEGAVDELPFFLNMAADAFAVQAAKHHEVEAIVAKRVAELDAVARMVQQRLVAVNLDLAGRRCTTVVKSAEKQSSRAANKWASDRQLLLRSQHKLAYHRGRWACSTCCKATKATAVAGSFISQPCVGPPADEGGGLPPAELVLGSAAMRDALTRCHRSHRLQARRGVVVCLRCGAWHSPELPRNRMQKLSSICFGPRITGAGPHVLRRWRKGEHPAKRPWPVQRDRGGSDSSDFLVTGSEGDSD